MSVSVASVTSYDESSVKDGLLRLLTSLGYPEDNPLSSIIKPGDKVFIKPNWVAHQYRCSCSVQDDVYSTITHPSIIRAVSDLVAQALGGEGEIMIGDNPSIDCNFPMLMDLMQIRDLETRYPVPCSILDLRPLWCSDLKHYGHRSQMTALPGDPNGTKLVDLGKDSLLYGVNPLLFRGVFKERLETIRNHFGGHQRYGFSKSIIDADVYISLPKLKTHHKVGTTLNLKGLVGANTIKNYLVHWRSGWPGIGGDEYPSFIEWLKARGRKTHNRGAWNGNDTIWRMVVDLYNAFTSAQGGRNFSIVDGIVGGEKDGPFCPRAKHSNIVLAGEDLIEVDLVASRLMGFNVMEIPYLRHFVQQKDIDLEAITVLSADVDTESFFDNSNRHCAFAPPSAWSNLLSCDEDIAAS